MRRRAFLAVPAVLAAGCGSGGSGGAAKPSVEPELSTSTDELTKLLPKLGPITAALWRERSSNEGGSDRSVPGPTDLFLHALIRLAPGGVATLTAGRHPVPAQPRSGTGQLAIPAAMVAAFPLGARWVADPELSRQVVAAESTRELYLDPASDTGYLFAVKASAPGSAMVDQNGATVPPAPSKS
ncbi:hypothetical protein ACIRPK_32815 [Kitasatospora sp. NPDC101801]|uniref:hypothetical protein n=1 Tax=Kitasatospora sp. NPDC101801 TaxID=3364103 RepID=UPI0038258B0A